MEGDRSEDIKRNAVKWKKVTMEASFSSIASSEYETTKHGVHYYDSSKVKSESVGKALIVGNKSSFKHSIDDHKSSNFIDSLQPENTMAGEHSCDLSKVKPESVGSKFSFKHLNDDHKSSNSIGSLEYEKIVPGVMQLNNRTVFQSEPSICLSRSSSYRTGLLYAEAKQSFTNTKNNDESDEASRKTSIYREQCH
ncbi:hypothetical protein V6N13_080091 [Hibiscus sabdariffa]|uniref:Uncharacterized protein n=1 Tax=Hibiscus sabdariffa TaxID=183260 RepID=A0ABR2RTJ1_9ROSI